MWFITSVIVVSAFGLPAVMCRAAVVSASRPAAHLSSLPVSLSLGVDSRRLDGLHHGGERRHFYNDYDLLHDIRVR